MPPILHIQLNTTCTSTELASGVKLMSGAKS